MLDLMPSLGSWRPAVSGQLCAVATIVGGTGGSVPRPMGGTSMMVSENGEILGSLSGGCVESAVVEAALEAMRDGGPRLESFGYSAEDAFAVGLTCGGELEVHIQPLRAGSPELSVFAETQRPAALIRRLDGQGGVMVVNDPVRFRTMESEELAKLLGDHPSTLFAAAAQVEPPLLQGGRAGLVRLAPPPEGCIDGWVTTERLALPPHKRKRSPSHHLVRGKPFAGSSDADLRRQRFRSGPAPGRATPRIQRHAVRRAACLRDAKPLRRRRPSGHRLATPLPGHRGSRRAHRFPHSGVHPDSRPPNSISRCLRAPSG